MDVINMGFTTSPYYLEADAVLKRIESTGASVPYLVNELNQKKYESLRLRKKIEDIVEAEGEVSLIFHTDNVGEHFRAAGLWRDALPQYQFRIGLNQCVVKKI